MTVTERPADDVRPITRAEAGTLASTENQRILDLLRSLDDDDWTKPTDCPPWQVRDLAGHVLGGMEGFTSVRQLAHMMRAAKKEARGGSFVDAMTAIQVRERADLSRTDLLARLATAGPQSAQFRARIPRPLRATGMKQELLSGQTETWRFGYLLDVILTRDTWMHRVDHARATGADLVLTAEHDGRIVADAVGEWGRRHGQPYCLEVTGPAGGSFTGGPGGPTITIDAVELCRTFSGRSTGAGLLTQEVPF
ncbi:MAG: maleylpyruvate isomerase family mycothiol-dependent enzyme [Acidimicrobiales bacterium]